MVVVVVVVVNVAVVVVSAAVSVSAAVDNHVSEIVQLYITSALGMRRNLILTSLTEHLKYLLVHLMAL